MRKRVLIPLLTILLIFVATFTFLQPRDGSVEWHRKRYLAAFNRLHEKDWRSNLSRHLDQRLKIKFVSFYPSGEQRTLLRKEVLSHRAALIRLGYLSEKLIVLSNVSARQAFFRPTKDWPQEPDERFLEFDFSGENTIRVIAPAASIGLWENYYRRLDMVGNGK